jgi:hypothetical protein
MKSSSSSAFALVIIISCAAFPTSVATVSSILKGVNVVVPARRNTDILKRMLQKAEKQSPPSNKNNKGGGGTNPPTATPTLPTSTTTSTAYYTGILLDTKASNEYIYNTPINVDFELNNQLNISTDILLNLNVSHVNDWELGVFMRMADPQGGALEPIFAVKPTTIVDKANAANSRRHHHRNNVRKLQKEEEKEVSVVLDAAAQTEAMVDAMSATNTANANAADILPPLTPPTVNYVGTAKISTTDATTLDPVLYGTGFDLYLLDERGAAILGPATFYMLPTEAMKEKEQEEIDYRPDHGLVNHDGTAKGALSKAGKATADKELIEKEAKAAKDMGYGSGTNGSMVLATREALANYVLTTDMELYEESAKVTVTYDITPNESSRRRSLQNIFGSGGAKTTSTTTTTQATVAAAATTTKGTTAAATTTTTTAAKTTTTKGTKGSTTTTSATTTTSGAIKLPPLPPFNDGENIKSYRMGVYMRMVGFFFIFSTAISSTLDLFFSPISLYHSCPLSRLQLLLLLLLLHFFLTRRHTPKMDLLHQSSPFPSVLLLQHVPKHPPNSRRERSHSTYPT